jgi:hypothetical protein
MAEQNERPRPHGDPLQDLVDLTAEDDRAQAEHDATPDATGEPHGDRSNNSDRAAGRGSDANGVPAFDEVDGATRKRLYRDGAELVSKID